MCYVLPAPTSGNLDYVARFQITRFVFLRIFVPTIYSHKTIGETQNTILVLDVVWASYLFRHPVPRYDKHMESGFRLSTNTLTTVAQSEYISAMLILAGDI